MHQTKKATPTLRNRGIRVPQKSIRIGDTASKRRTYKARTSHRAAKKSKLATRVTLTKQE